ncbi:lipoate--protein ligase [Anaerofustis stercorihominis]|nr:lipoate--protein ligase [Anaerofustis stercorihominis]MCQ4795062.1 lipoate--protein ligase [Anaerofustis stercorihominis]RGD75475.1 lipoate--protein ligase [Anaerofustis stercorihominis]
MKYIKTRWNIPYYNMAFENYVMNNDDFKDDYVFFYIHSPSIIVGKHQNTIEEINSKYVKENDIIVARRNTGGGAVYHDEGNLNFSFITTKKEDENEIDFKKYTLPIINALKKLGVDAYLSGRNDILVDGKKISGNAQGLNKNKVLHHGTLMFNVDVESLVNSLNVSQMKIESKAIKSVKSRVLNIKDVLDIKMDIYQFKDFILDEIFSEMDMEEYRLTDKDYENIEKLVKDKYGTWEFNYGYSPKFSIKNKKKFESSGLIEVMLDVKSGIIEDIKISGDYFSVKETDELEDMIKGFNYREDDIKSLLETIKLDDYITNIKNEEFISLLFD